MRTEIEVRVNAEPRPLVSKGGCRVAVSFPNLLNTHFLSGYEVDDPLNTHSTPTIFFTVFGRWIFFSKART